ncbi:Coatomer, beta subunit [Linderina pennispora]|uniref:Coatomer subunit beta n=1 Tax=Linderina pennispora TaxID=61395 RepID=A0A1Y1WII4_9FUNG|nr:Coatomer, beta subunit [Linderina pennispora]ORX73349.1 Coatomer, beta subunit [Linderina pennispora]
MATTAAKSSADACYTLIHPSLDVEIPNLQTLRRNLERGTDEIKREALQQVIAGTIQGENYEQLLMHIIPSLKKLLLFYWEVCPKYSADGTLKHETILICNALLNDLQHPNEFIRGATLRFLCKLREAELLEPLVGPTRENLEHRHAYVRKNAVMAISSIYRCLPHLVPDAPELIYSFLVAEADMTCRRNALTMLTACAPEVAVQWLKENVQLVASFDELLQLAVVDLIRRASREFPSDKALFIRCIFELLGATSNSVKYDAATTLVSLTANPAAIKGAAACYITLVAKESDNNVKLIVLERLDQLRMRHEGILDDLVMDLLRVLTSPDLDVRRKALNIVMNLTSRRNINEVVAVLKKELGKTADNSDDDKSSEYRLLLIQTIHQCAGQFPEVAADVVDLFLDSIAEFGATSATDAIVFVREVAEKFPDLRQSIVQNLVHAFLDFKTGKVIRGALWILELPLLAAEQRELDGLSNPDGAESTESRPAAAPSASRRILPDGTYATESSLTAAAAPSSSSLKFDSKPPSADFFTGTVLASTLAKLVNSLRAEAVLIMAGIIRIGQSTFDSYDRVLSCIRALEYMDTDSEVLTDAFISDTQSAFSRLVSGEAKRAAEEKKKDSKDTAVQKTVDDDSDSLKRDIELATGEAESRASLTGFSDAVYAEAYVSVNQYDILLDIMVVNQTNTTLRNLSIEFSTLGDLKLVEKPMSYNVAPFSFSSVKANIKVSSTETGVIFGTIVYDGPGYIRPSRCDEAQFHSMWTEFEWENKVNMSTTAAAAASMDLRAYLKHIMKATNMACLTPENALEGDCGFLSANLYARSIFGEDALANISIEKPSEDAPITGHIRIRAKTQGIALSLGDKISAAKVSLQE